MSRSSGSPLCDALNAIVFASGDQDIWMKWAATLSRGMFLL